MDKNKILLLIDANSLIHRCFHALPPFTDPENNPVGAIYGISNILLKIINDKKPDYAAALFDRPEPTFRKEMFDEYKAHRPKAPNELISQIIEAHKLFDIFSIKTLELPGYEADDLIGTLADKFKKESSLNVLILTGDLDSLQLIEDKKIAVETFKRGISDTIIYDEQKVFERFGVKPNQLIDYKALVGDQSDNIPGVSGIGPKTASEIIRKYNNLDSFFKNGLKEKNYEKIFSSKDIALLSKKLVTINTHAPIDVVLEELECSPNKNIITSYFEEKGFSSLIKRISDKPTRTVVKEIKKESDFKQISIFSNEDFIIINPEFLNLKIFSSDKIKIGFGLKDVFKKYELKDPYFDISIALKLLGIQSDTWEEASLIIFKESLSYEDFCRKAYPWLTKKITDSKIEYVFKQIETPLIPVIAEMEKNGVLVEEKTIESVLKELVLEINKKNDDLVKKIGKPINLNSPKQLLEYFQNDLKIKINSTSAKSLEKIKEKNALPIFDELTSYRELFKIKTTYLDSFKKLISSDGRIHPTFLQLGAATGRLSCQNPNLQNIPQESDWSQKIRNIFIAPKNHTLVSFDYSQIELRVLASLSGDKNMIEAFNNKEDIHSVTAQKIFDTSKENVTSQMRRVAKTLNFGMMYGMGYRALAQTAHITPQEAKDFIKKYFDEFSAIKEWQKKIIQEAQLTGVVRNINGRFRSVSGINSVNQQFYSEAERMVTNMPSQSLAADILKISMIKVYEYIQSKHPQDIKMILSIHDELIFEIKESLLENKKNSLVIKNIKELMENSFKLKVPLEVVCRMGKYWGEIN